MKEKIMPVVYAIGKVATMCMFFYLVEKAIFSYQESSIWIWSLSMLVVILIDILPKNEKVISFFDTHYYCLFIILCLLLYIFFGNNFTTEDGIVMEMILCSENAASAYLLAKSLSRPNWGYRKVKEEKRKKFNDNYNENNKHQKGERNRK